MNHLPAFFALLVAIVGWYYLFNTRAAHRLHDLEDEALNQRRIRLRRINGLVMLALGAGLYAAIFGIDPDRNPTSFVVVGLLLMALLGIFVWLGLIDLRLTLKLSENRRAYVQRGDANDEPEDH